MSDRWGQMSIGVIDEAVEKSIPLNTARSKASITSVDSKLTMSNDKEPKIKTIPQDARYHNCNATKWCYATFVDFHKCKRLLGDGNECCNQFSQIYKVICPNEWIKRWEEQMETGIFPVDFPPEKNECKQKSKQKT